MKYGANDKDLTSFKLLSCKSLG